MDFAQHRFAFAVPLLLAAEDAGALIQVGEMDFLDAGGAEFVEFGSQCLEECEFESVARLHRGVEQGNGDRRGDGLQVLRNAFAADLAQHPLHAVEKFLKCQHFERAL